MEHPDNGLLLSAKVKQAIKPGKKHLTVLGQFPEREVRTWECRPGVKVKQPHKQQTWQIFGMAHLVATPISF